MGRGWSDEYSEWNLSRGLGLMKSTLRALKGWAAWGRNAIICVGGWPSHEPSAIKLRFKHDLNIIRGWFSGETRQRKGSNPFGLLNKRNSLVSTRLSQSCDWLILEAFAGVLAIICSFPRLIILIPGDRYPENGIFELMFEVLVNRFLSSCKRLEHCNSNFSLSVQEATLLHHFFLTRKDCSLILKSDKLFFVPFAEKLQQLWTRKNKRRKLVQLKFRNESFKDENVCI